MKLSRLYTALYLLVLPFIGFSQTPLIQDCNCEKNQECYDIFLNNFLEVTSTKIIEERGYYFNDSIYISFAVKGPGKIKVTKSFHLFSEEVEQQLIDALESKATIFCETDSDQEYSISFNFELPDQFENYPSVSNVDDPLPVIQAIDFNLKGKRAAARYLIGNMESYLRKVKSPKGDHEGVLYFSEGKIVAIEFTSLDAEDFYADHIIQAWNNSTENFLNFRKADLSDDQWVSFRVGKYRDSTKAYDYGLDHLKYLSTLASKQPFLDEMIEFSYINFNDESRPGFILKQLSVIGYDKKESFRSGDKVYKIDSLVNYVFNKPEDSNNKILQFHLVERIPVYPGCDKDASNEELKTCFQKNIIKHVSETFEYPKTAQKKGIQGRTYVNFVIEKDGIVDEIKVVRGSHYLLDFEAIRVVSLLPDMTAASQRKKPVRMSFTLPINAKLR